MDTIKPLPTFPPSTKRPGPSTRPALFLHNLARGNLSLPTWIALGAAAQSLLLLLLAPRAFQPVAAAPALLYLACVALDTAAQSAGWTPNRALPHTLRAKFTGIFPAGGGPAAAAAAAATSVCVFVLGFTSYHPLGMLAPGAREMGEHARAMMDELEGDAAERWGILGRNAFQRLDGAAGAAGIYQVFHFRDKEDVIRFAHGEVHREGWAWFNKVTKRYPHLGVMHELYQVPAGEWENLYINHEPMLSTDLRLPVKTPGGETQWISSVVDAGRGKLSSTRGRLG